MKKSISVLLLFIFSIISWIIWIIEVNPFITNTWDWIDEKKITFVVTPILFLLWAYFSRLITRIPRFIINLIIFYIFFGVILCLILIAHIAGPSALLIIFSPFKFLLYKPISLILISLFTFGFNNMDSILWFKSGIIIPISFIYEGIILLGKRNISESKSSLLSEMK